ncbi:lactadherin-like [Branchiostoma floridae x Branchiostoma japonicum]
MAGPCPPGFWRWAALMLIVTTASVTGQGCYDALGVADDSKIPDGSITASSALPSNPPHAGRLNSASYWAPSQNEVGEWLQVDLGAVARVTGSIIQGSSGSWIKTYKLQYSMLGISWTTYGFYGSDKIFDGNTDDSNAVENQLTQIYARYVRFVVQSWNVGVAMRIELQGCTVCNSDLLGVADSTIPPTGFTASSALSSSHENAGRLRGSSWAPSQNVVGEWLQVDLGEMTQVTGTKVQGSSGSWITSYKLQYSDDGTRWTTYVGSDGSDKIFGGNTDDSTVVANELENPVNTRYVRFVVQEWNVGIALLVDVVGCTGRYLL